MSPRFFPRISRALLFLFLCGPHWTGPAFAIDWIGGAGDWGLGGNWSGGSVPGPADAVRIANGGTALIGAADYGAASLQLGLAVPGTITQTGGSLTVQGTAFLGNNGVAGVYNLGGTLSAGGIAINNGGVLRVAADNAIGFSGGNLSPIVVHAGGTLTTQPGNTSALGALTLNGGTLADDALNTTETGPWYFYDKTQVTADSTISARRLCYLDVFAVQGGAKLAFSGTIAPYSPAGDPNAPYHYPLTKDGAGAMIVTGDSRGTGWTGDTYILAGTLQIGNGGTAGDLGSTNYLNEGVLAVNRSDDYTLRANVSGTGSLVKKGGGTLFLDGADGYTYSYTGSTVINQGTLALADGDDLGPLSAISTSAGATFQINGGAHTVGTIGGLGAVKVLDGELTAAAIVQNALAIGATAAVAVPEPGCFTSLLAVFSAIGIFIYLRRMDASDMAFPRGAWE
ncbi:MAG: autotransporter-associated beta strand repeat-containing protein [Pirellulales bacterium]|nr:autotransporter-associated beta strand repeat-containing protein [Pirellulales bacterium]